MHNHRRKRVFIKKSSPPPTSKNPTSRNPTSRNHHMKSRFCFGLMEISKVGKGAAWFDAQGGSSQKWGKSWRFRYLSHVPACVCISAVTKRLDGSRYSSAQSPDIRFPNHRIVESSFLFKKSKPESELSRRLASWFQRRCVDVLCSTW